MARKGTVSPSVQPSIATLELSAAEVFTVTWTGFDLAGHLGEFLLELFVVDHWELQEDLNNVDLAALSLDFSSEVTTGTWRVTLNTDWDLTYTSNSLVI